MDIRIWISNEGIVPLTFSYDRGVEYSFLSGTVPDLTSQSFLITMYFLSQFLFLEIEEILCVHTYMCFKDIDLRFPPTIGHI